MTERDLISEYWALREIPDDQQSPETW